MRPRSCRSATGWPRCCATDNPRMAPKRWGRRLGERWRERSHMAEQLSGGKRIAFLVANEGVEQVELTRPWEAVREAGAAVVLIAPETGGGQAFNDLDNADTLRVVRHVADGLESDY